MTKKDAKELTLEVWRYLMWHPWLVEKQQIPNKIYQKIVNLKNRCPLCEVMVYMVYGKKIPNCITCPLEKCLPGT